MKEQHNITGKTSEDLTALFMHVSSEDLTKIIIKDLIDGKIKAAQDEIMKQDNKECDYLKTTTKQLIMAAKNKGDKLLDVNFDKNISSLVGGVLEIRNMITKDGIEAQFTYNSLTSKTSKYSLISYKFSFNSGITGCIDHKSIGENIECKYNSSKKAIGNKYGIDILNSDVLKTIQEKFDPECVVTTNEHFKVYVKKMDFEDIERMCEAYFISGVLSLLTQYDDAEVDTKVMGEAKELEDKMYDDIRLYYYKFAETTSEAKTNDVGTMKEVGYHKDVKTDDVGTMKEVWYHKEAKTDDVGTMKEEGYYKDVKTDDVGTMKEVWCHKDAETTSSDYQK